jgi:hypothetical protein
VFWELRCYVSISRNKNLASYCLGKKKQKNEKRAIPECEMLMFGNSTIMQVKIRKWNIDVGAEYKNRPEWVLARWLYHNLCSTNEEATRK